MSVSVPRRGLRATPTLTVVSPIEGVCAPGERVVLAVRAADLPVEGASLFVNGRLAAPLGSVPAGGEVRFAQAVGDRAGLNTAGLRDPEGNPLGDDVEFYVRPDPVPVALWERVTEDRLPELLGARGGRLAPRGIGSGLADPLDRIPLPTEAPALPDERGMRALELASEALLALTPRILQRLASRSRKEVRIRRDVLKGRVNWPATLRRQAARGAEGRLEHVCERRRRTWVTPLNLLFVSFHATLVREGRRAIDRLFRREEAKARWRERVDAPARSREGIVAAIEPLEARLRRHVAAAMHPLLVEPLAALRTDPPALDEAFLRDCQRDGRRNRNRAYRELVAAWEDFQASYPKSRPEARTLDAASVEEVYNTWVALELAAACDAPPPVPDGAHVRPPAVIFSRLAGIDPAWLGAAAGPGGPVDHLRSKARPDLEVRLPGTRILVNTRFALEGPGADLDLLNRTLGNCAAAGVSIGLLVTVEGPPRVAAGGPGGSGFGPYLLARVPFGPQALAARLDGGAAYLRRVLGAVERAAARLERDPQGAADTLSSSLAHQ